MQITAPHDGGNIVVLSTDRDTAHLEMRPDEGSGFFQWFYFRLTGCRGVPCRLSIDNAGRSSYPAGWKDYRAVCSSDGEQWRRVDTTYDGKSLVIQHTPKADAVWFAAFAPYSQARHDALLVRSQQAGARLTSLGSTLDGADIDLLTVGTGPAQIWIVARQHPGETMAEWFVDGLLDRLLSPDSAPLLQQATFSIVPNMNPDGSRRGHLRSNAVGENLNRAWDGPSQERTPEVFFVRNEMDRTGVDLCMDVHGDEALPYNFFSPGMLGIPNLTDRQRRLYAAFSEAMVAASPEFQAKYGYPQPRPGKANPTICANQVAARFSSLAVTLEMPFKDNADLPDATWGWSPGRARRLGADCLTAIQAVLPTL
ncbi:MAG: murein tripeptide amidase MpaA [Myxococcota bacterium]|jgi:murein tripeptide amidase MpaA